MSGVRVRFLNRDDVLPRLVSLARRLLESRADVLQVSLFGSLARGNHAPGSDADLFVLLEKDTRRFIERVPEFLKHFSGIGLPIEVFPYTLEEISEMQDDFFLKTIQREKIVLAERAKIEPEAPL